MRKLVLVLALFLLALPVFAQADLAGETVSLEASDGLVLVGDLYRPESSEEAKPAILLMHMLGSSRRAYEPLLPYLLDAGYIVLNVDLRGHGESGRLPDWELAQGDVQTWLDWLREQDGVDGSRIAIIGASIGSNLALVGCFNDEACVTAIALSPGEAFRGVLPLPAIEGGLDALLFAAHNDRESSIAVRNFFSSATGTVEARLYLGRSHGTELFSSNLETVAATILLWLEERFAAVE